MLARAAINLLRAIISDDRVGCPEQRVGVGVYRFARVDEPWTVDQPQHRLTQRFGPSKLGAASDITGQLVTRSARVPTSSSSMPMPA